MTTALDSLAVNTLRTLSIDAVQRANSGHPGMPLGAAVMAYALWSRFLRYDPHDPHWIDRDRFVLSAGHGSALLYSLLHLSGYDLPMDELKRFRQWNSRTPGHPEVHLTPGVEATTGPLGQGVGNLVGMAIAREHLAAKFNTPQRPLITYRVFGICSDGDLMEGVASEAASLAGHLGLGCITLLYDDNHITIDGGTELTFTEDVAARFAAYGWHVLQTDGMDLEAVESAIVAGVDETQRPTLICCRTTIGFGSPNKAGTSKVHGAPLGEEEVALTKRALNWPGAEPFFVPDEVREHFRKIAARGGELRKQWASRLDAARYESPEFAEQWETFWSRRLPAGWHSLIPEWKSGDKPLATRKASESVLNALAPEFPWMIGGSADLAESNLTYLRGAGDFQKASRGGRNLRFGIREHGMGAILNGIAASGPFIAFGSTFLAFLDYMKPSVRLAALSRLPVIYVFTHDSIGLGEDGPTHQPIEQLWTLRATPNVWVFRPADARETAECWRLAIERTDGPTALALTRQNLPILDVPQSKLGVEKGAYVVAEASRGAPECVLLATGSEVSLALAARVELEKLGLRTRVVSMPCLELFDAQPAAYRESVIPPQVLSRLAIEAGATCGWWKYTGSEGDVLGLDCFGASAPADVLFEKFGFSVSNVVRRVQELVKRNG